MTRKDIEDDAQKKCLEHWTKKEKDIFCGGFWMGAHFVLKQGYDVQRVKEQSLVHDIPYGNRKENYIQRDGFEEGALWMAVRVKEGDELLD